MITETKSHKSNPAITSDRWHVVHARWNGAETDEPQFDRSIVSEHDDREGATRAAGELHQSLAGEMNSRREPVRDQLFVRRPDFKTLRTAARVERKR